MADLDGMLVNPPGHSGARIAYVRNRDVIAEGPVGSDGKFASRSGEESEWLIVQALAPRVSAVAVPSRPGAYARLPDTARVSFRPVGAPQNAMMWLDPVELTGFPSQLVWALRTHADRSIDLHVLEAPLYGGTVELELQPGSYRLSAGLQSIRPWEPPTQLSGVTDLRTGLALSVSGGQSILEIDGNSSFELVFTKDAHG